jgi:hypothetical protein
MKMNTEILLDGYDTSCVFFHPQAPADMEERVHNSSIEKLRQRLLTFRQNGIDAEEYEVLKKKLNTRPTLISKYPGYLQVVEEYYEKWQCNGGYSTKAAQ